MPRKIILDLDDFAKDNNRLDVLDDLKLHIPQLVLTAFTIPGLADPAWCRNMRRERPWIDLVPHGYWHGTSRECEKWSRYETEQYCRALFGNVEPGEGSGVNSPKAYYARGFKAPGWQLSDEVFAVMHEQGYWIADQPYNRHRRPIGLRYYEIGDDSIHGHFGHMGGHNENELEYILPQILENKDAEFSLVRNNLQVWEG